MSNGTTGTTVPKHWIVAGYTPPLDPTNPLDTGVLGGVWGIGTSGKTGTVYFTLLDAQNQAKALAAANPGAIFVVYEANWWAQVNVTPVGLYPVLFAPTS